MICKPLYDQDAYQKFCDAHIVASEDQNIILDQSICYPLGGGQLGDTGKIMIDRHSYHITNTQRNSQNQIVHQIREPISSNLEGQAVRILLDWDRRHRIMRFHTALHVLHKIAKFTCTGAKVGPDKAHLDFDTLGEKLNSEIVDRLNDILAQGHPVKSFTISEQEIKNRADFMDSIRMPPPVHNDSIRFVQIGTDDNKIDLQPCGGTHVKNTAEIGELRVLKNKSHGRKNRRLTLGFAS